MADLNYVIDPVTHTVTVDVDSNRIVIPPTDTTLTVAGKAADAKATGDAIGEVVSSVASLDRSKVDKVPGKGLSTQDFTTTLKNKLDGIEQEANKTTVDSSLSSSSTNPVQNKVIKAALDGKQATEAGKGLSTEDFTTTLKNKLDGIEQGANKTEIVNNTTTEDSTKALSAAQGKALNEAKVNISDIQNDLTSTATNKPLSAAQGKNLSDTIATLTTMETVTPTMVLTPSRADVFTVRKIGHVCQLYLQNVMFPGTWSSDTKIATVDLLPIRNVYGFVFDTSGNIVRIWIGTNGDIVLVNNNNRLLYGTLTFFVC